MFEDFWKEDEIHKFSEDIEKLKEEYSSELDIRYTEPMFLFSPIKIKFQKNLGKIPVIIQKHSKIYLLMYEDETSKLTEKEKTVTIKGSAISKKEPDLREYFNTILSSIML